METGTLLVYVWGPFKLLGRPGDSALFNQRTALTTLGRRTWVYRNPAGTPSPGTLVCTYAPLHCQPTCGRHWGLHQFAISRVDGPQRRVCTVDDVSETCVDFDLHSDFNALLDSEFNVRFDIVSLRFDVFTVNLRFDIVNLRFDIVNLRFDVFLALSNIPYCYGPLQLTCEYSQSSLRRFRPWSFDTTTFNRHYDTTYNTTLS